MLVSNFSNRLKETIEKRKIKPSEIVRQSELLFKLGKINKPLTKPLLSNYIKGSYEAKQDNIHTLSLILNVDEAWLMGLDVPMEKKQVTHIPLNKGKTRKIPVVGKVAAGFDVNAIVDVIGWEEIDETFPESNTYFGLLVQGNSMEPRIYAGDVVIVRSQPDIESGEYAIVRVNGDNATIKRVSKDSNGITLIPLNNAYLPKFYSNEDILNIPVEIIGKVVELRGKF